MSSKKILALIAGVLAVLSFAFSIPVVLAVLVLCVAVFI